MNVANEYRYHRLTWEEMNEAIALQKVVMPAVCKSEPTTQDRILGYAEI